MAEVAAEAVLAMQAGRSAEVLAAELEAGLRLPVRRAPGGGNGVGAARAQRRPGAGPPPGLRLRPPAPTGRRGRRRRRPAAPFRRRRIRRALVGSTMGSERQASAHRTGGGTIPREALLARTLVELADSLVEDFDVVELLTLLADRCVDVIDVGRGRAHARVPGRRAAGDRVLQRGHARARALRGPGGRRPVRGLLPQRSADHEPEARRGAAAAGPASPPRRSRRGSGRCTRCRCACGAGPSAP